MWAIMGGTGFDKFPEFQILDSLDTETPYGHASSGAARATIGSTDIIFVPRHGALHEKTPSEINYRANIYLLKKLGVTKILSISAVGSLHEDLRPGDVVVPTQYLDRTKGIRSHTFSGNGLVGHIPLANPVSLGLVDALREHAPRLEAQFHFDKTYVCIEGPAFSTKAESHYYRSIGAHVVGMSNFPEYALAAEAGMHYLPCCFPTDYDCWRESDTPVTVEQIIRIMGQNRELAYTIARVLIPLADHLFPNGRPETSIANAMLNHPSTLKEEHRALLSLF